ncbi:MAG: efflux RND transporter periplasmic adaptor subunit, partial [Ruminococcus sp.]|nr:efflux RND transporter periplasmic adaptor subunit [Ruminococcus sp.]
MNNENKSTRKDMIKNIAIVFLAVLLVLTFFSNTFMNYSLPQVSAVYVSQGNISEQIRGSGTIEPAEKYEVKFEQSRAIKSVAVKQGQTVEAGDGLFELE